MNDERKREKLERIQDELLTPEQRNLVVLGRIVQRLDRKSKEDRLFFENLIKAIAERTSVRIDNLDEIAPLEIKNLDTIPREVEVKNLPEVQEVKIGERPEWYRDPPEQIKAEIINLPEQKEISQPTWLEGLIANTLEALGGILAKLAGTLFEKQAQLLGMLWDKGIDVRFRRPQATFLIDPKTGKPADLETFGAGGRIISYGGGGTSIVVSDPSQSQFSHGSNSSVGTTTAQMTSVSFSAKKGVLVKAASTNSGKVYVGNSSSTTANTNDATDGIELSAGDAVIIAIDNPNKIYVIGSAASQRVYWIAV